MENMREEVLETVANPTLVLKGDFGELLAVKRFQKTPLTQKFFGCGLLRESPRGRFYFDSLSDQQASRKEESGMEAIKILERPKSLDWEYDEEGDVLYLSIGRPRKATGVDIGQGVVIRYDEKKKEVVGLTVLGVRAKLLESLKK